MLPGDLLGKAGGWASTLELSTLDGTTGFRLDGAARSVTLALGIQRQLTNRKALDKRPPGPPEVSSIAFEISKAVSRAQ